jgi:hypothetical protein
MKTALTLSSLLAVASIAAWTTAVPAPAVEAREMRPSARPVPVVDTIALAAAAARIRARNAFRIDRKPTDVLYNPWEPSAPPPPPVPPRAVPQLVLAGLVGPPWNALLEGVPGRETGVLLALGEELNGITFAALRGDTVLLSGLDTTWTLTARRAWQR